MYTSSMYLAAFVSSCLYFITFLLFGEKPCCSGWERAFKVVLNVQALLLLISSIALILRPEYFLFEKFLNYKIYVQNCMNCHPILITELFIFMKFVLCSGFGFLYLNCRTASSVYVIVWELPLVLGVDVLDVTVTSVYFSGV